MQLKGFLRSPLAVGLLLAAAFTAGSIWRASASDFDTGIGAVNVQNFRLDSTVVAQPASPLHIIGCNGSVSVADRSLGLAVTQSVDMQYTGKDTITAVRARFALYDEFGTKVAETTAVAHADIAPGQTYDGMHVEEWNNVGRPIRETCAIDAIRYADGHITQFAPTP